LPGEVFDVLRDVVTALSQGLAITVAPHQTVLLDQMVTDSEDGGLYDLPDEVPFERLPVSDDQPPK
jgi:hypothetical protein